jgi:Protein of unknown function (DUF3592)
MSEQTLVNSDIQQSKGDGAIPSSDSVISPADVFLLNPGNRGYLLGKSRRIGDRVLLRELLPFIGLVPLLLLGLWGMVRFVSVVSEWSQLNRDNTPNVTGTIAERHTSTGKSTTYYVTYGFNANDQAYQREQIVSQGTYARLVEGTPVTVKYLRSDPRISALSGSDSDDTYLISLTIAMVIFIPLLALMLVAMRNMFRQIGPKVERKRQLMREGKLVKGQVLSSYGTESRGNYRVTVRYGFRAPDSHDVIKLASRNRNDLTEAALPKAGTTVAVVYVNAKCLELL